jgi:hypothetical protein
MDEHVGGDHDSSIAGADHCSVVTWSEQSCFGGWQPRKDASEGGPFADAAQGLLSCGHGSTVALRLAPVTLASMSALRPIAALVAFGGVLLALTGCTPAVTMDPAADADNPLCAQVVVRLPDALGEDNIRETNAQGTGAWGDPSSVLLFCGVPTPGPTTARCLNISGVDWIEDDTKAPVYSYTTYGRTPATQVVIDSTKASGGDVLPLLSEAVEEIPAKDACVGPEDVPSD